MRLKMKILMVGKMMNSTKQGVFVRTIAIGTLLTSLALFYSAIVTIYLGIQPFSEI